MPGILSISSIVLPHWCTTSRHIVRMAASHTTNAGVSFEAVAIKPPSHPTYDLKGIIKLALAEDAGNRGRRSIGGEGESGDEATKFESSAKYPFLGHIGITVDDTIKASERFEHLGVEFVKKPNDGHAFINNPDDY